MSEHEDKVQNRYKEKHQTLKGAVTFDDDLQLKTALNDRTRPQFFKICEQKTSMSTLGSKLRDRTIIKKIAKPDSISL